MPVLIGGFGKRKIANNVINNYSHQNVNLGSYLAGLIEGVGNIIVSDKTHLIRICFNIKDKSFLLYLYSKLDIGYIIHPKKRGCYDNYILWEITNYNDLLKIVNLINGYFRTPKLEALNN